MQVVVLTRCKAVFGTSQAGAYDVVDAVTNLLTSGC